MNATSDKEKSYTQKTMENFVPELQLANTTLKKGGNAESELETIHSELSQIKIMLSNLALSDQPKIVIEQPTIDETIKSCQRLEQIQHDNINIEITEEGCKLTCRVCADYIQNSQDVTR